jgi:competence protein ComEA
VDSITLHPLPSKEAYMRSYSFYAAVAALSLALSSLVRAEPVNINVADAATISKALVGVGPAKAQAIVQYRQANGPFKTADELALVKGIGPKVIEKNRANIKLDRARAPTAPATAPKPAAAKPSAPRP